MVNFPSMESKRVQVRFLSIKDSSGACLIGSLSWQRPWARSEGCKGGERGGGEELWVDSKLSELRASHYSPYVGASERASGKAS